MTPEVGGLGLGGPRGKGSPSVSKGPKPPIQLLQMLKNSPREVKRAHFRYIYLWGSPGFHPGNIINGVRRGRFLPVPPPRGVADGGGSRGSGPPLLKTAGIGTARNLDISVYFFLKKYIFAFSNIFKTKWPKSEEKPNFGGRWVWVPMTPTPQYKIRGDAPAPCPRFLQPCP